LRNFKVDRERVKAALVLARKKTAELKNWTASFFSIFDELYIKLNK